MKNQSAEGGQKLEEKMKKEQNKESQNEDLEKFLVEFLNEITNKKFKKLNEIVGKKIEIRCSVPVGKQNGEIFKVEKFFSDFCSSVVSYVVYSSEKMVNTDVLADIKKNGKDGLILRIGFSGGHIEFDMESGIKKRWKLFMADNKIEVVGKVLEDYLQFKIFD
ncbi:MAG: hypothetical protein PHY40_01130 [Patescibacteria group bacterium]|nr:hypothetical protein [Patescibacteria group bacterium]